MLTTIYIYIDLAAAWSNFGEARNMVSAGDKVTMFDLRIIAA